MSKFPYSKLPTFPDWIGSFSGNENKLDCFRSFMFQFQIFQLNFFAFPSDSLELPPLLFFGAQVFSTNKRSKSKFTKLFKAKS